MKRAKELLGQTRLPVFEIADRVGYQKPSHFSARFRSVWGCSLDAFPEVFCTVITEPRKNQKLFSKTWAQTLGHRSG